MSGPVNAAFDHDVALTGGYRYAGGHRLSCRLANARVSRAVFAAASFEGAHVIDIGCGDGTYSLELAAVGGAAKVHGVDRSAGAVEAAASRTGTVPTVTFARGEASDLPHADAAFDIALLRGVLHHVDDPRDVLREALRVASTVVVLEPNGLNPGVKLLERASPYHRAHGERSYTPRRLEAWVSALGGHVVHRDWVGFVPVFSPDSYARLAKRIEPLVEGTPMRRVGCAQYVLTARSCLTRRRSARLAA